MPDTDVQDHAKALHSDLFEVGVFDAVAHKMALRTWDLDSLLQSEKWLRYQNANGKDIYIRPAGEHAMSLVDDLTPQSVAKMREDGVIPAALVQTSPGNFQAWVYHGQVLPKDVSTQIARDLASAYGGDLKAADWRHFGRLAGFTNRKPKHLQPNGHQPFCRLLWATGQSYDRAGAYITRAETAVAEQQKALLAQRREILQAPVRGPAKTIDAFRNDPRYEGDAHRSDYAYSLYALSHGVPEHQVASAIAGRDLGKKGNPVQQQRYVEGTIKKALSRIGGLGR
jgi:hypothetical protein